MGPGQDDGRSRFHPNVETIILIHERILASDTDTSPGVRDRGSIDYITEYVEHGQFGQGPETIHEKGFQYLRLLAANHPFVDGNKRTAIATTLYFYRLNGYVLEYGEEIEAMVKLLGVREDILDPAVTAEYLSEIARPVS